MNLVRQWIGELNLAFEMPAARPKVDRASAPSAPSPCKETSNAKGESSNAVLFS
jgi:hypothetical protein